MSSTPDYVADIEETRTFVAPLHRIDVSEERAADNEPVLRVTGMAAVFDEWSNPIGGMFREEIKRGAFRRVLSENPDVVFSVNHNLDAIPYARTSNGTLKLEETPRGLEIEAVLRDTHAGHDLYQAIQRGDLNKMSFMFTVKRDEWRIADENGELDERSILEIGSLIELGPVSQPAYPQTSIQANSGGMVPTNTTQGAVIVNTLPVGNVLEQVGEAPRREQPTEATVDESDADRAKDAHQHRARKIAIQRNRHNGTPETGRGA